MSTNKTSRWADDLPSIQFMKNTRYHRGLGMSPYEAFFGVKPRLGLANLNLDKEVTDEIWTEELGVSGNSRWPYKFLGISVFCSRVNLQ